MRLILPFPGNDTFARHLAEAGGWELGQIETRRFPDGECYVRITSGTWPRAAARRYRPRHRQAPGGADVRRAHGALDSRTGVVVIDARLASNAQLGTTTLIITHNAAIQAVADRVIHFADGRISRTARNETRRAAAELSW